MRFPTLVVLSMTAAAMLAAGACNRGGDAARAASLKPSKERREAPDFTLKDADGKTVRLSDYRGKVVLLNFWATWCTPCRIEIPWFMEFEREHKDDGFAVLGISLDEEGWDVVKPYLERMKVNYRVLMGDDSLTQLYGGVESLPTSFMIDREGRIASVHIGLVSRSDYQNEIEELLAAKRGGLAPGRAAAIPAVFVRAD